MKKAFVLSLLIMVLPTLTFGAENVVTSKTLGISDVENHAQMALKHSGYKGKVISVLGIHQTGNKATVYYSYISKSLKKPYVRNFNIIRLNSGKWFNYSMGEFVVK